MPPSIQTQILPKTSHLEVIQLSTDIMLEWETNSKQKLNKQNMALEDSTQVTPKGFSLHQDKAEKTYFWCRPGFLIRGYHYFTQSLLQQPDLLVQKLSQIQTTCLLCSVRAVCYSGS